MSVRVYRHPARTGTVATMGIRKLHLPQHDEPGGCLCLFRLTLDPQEVLAWGDHSVQDVLVHAALSAKWENNDAIDRAVTNALGHGDPNTLGQGGPDALGHGGPDALGRDGREALREFEVLRTIPFNPVDKRTTAYVRSADGNEFVATKGAPQVIFMED